ncbi:phosphate propanoyltransferase [Fusobacterium polymorphum]|uniref:phosphate propanoyltransferase n=1 Tax=Fusobacterium nucleatum subsp. polymorphum TaxID=76857 RepID=UPI0022E12D07|nr:phosphate propanoyltransferase [Fusobacterium polymorphum]
MKDIKGIIKEVLEEVISDDVVIGVSNRHIHLSQKDLDTLFGEGYKLSKMKDMKQPGQFATNEKLDIVGPKGKFSGVRIIGPVRKETQVEISITDSFKLGLTPPIRQSGDLEGTPGIKIVGPKGEIEIPKGVIVAGRHIHMPKYIADIRGYKDGEIVKVETYGERKIIMCNVVLRVSDKMAKEMHIDVDEANAAGLKNDDYVKIIRE